MLSTILTALLAALALVLYLAIAVVLVRKYLRTHDVGLVWLGMAVVAWPLVCRLLDEGERVYIRRIFSGRPVEFYPFRLAASGQITLGTLITLLNLSQQLIGVGLLLVAVLYLYKTKSCSNLPSATGM